MGAAVIVAAVARAQRALLAHFRAADATHPDRAVDLPDHLRPHERRRMQAWMRCDVVRPGAGGGYWLDEAALARWQQGQRRGKLVVVALLLVVLGLALAAGIGLPGGPANQ
jgi:hypothetical protein